MPLCLALPTLTNQIIWLIYYLGFCSGPAEVSILLGCGTMSLSDWCLTLQDSMVVYSPWNTKFWNRGTKRPLMSHHIPKEQRLSFSSFSLTHVTKMFPVIFGNTVVKCMTLNYKVDNTRYTPVLCKFLALAALPFRFQFSGDVVLHQWVTGAWHVETERCSLFQGSPHPNRMKTFWCILQSEVYYLHISRWCTVKCTPLLRKQATELKNKRSTWCHLLFYFTSYVLNMFQTLISPSSGACDCVVELPHWLFCSQFVVWWRFGATGFE